MTQGKFLFILCTWHAENTPTQALAKVLNFTFGCRLGSQTGTCYLHPSVSALGTSTSAQAAGREHLWLNQLFLSRVFLFIYLFLLPSSLSPFLTMNLLVLWDSSRSKQAVTSACSLWRKGSQNLNIYGMQCETKIPVLLVLVFWGLFIAAACVFLGCCPAKSDVPRGKKKPFACVEILLSSCFLSHTCSWVSARRDAQDEISSPFGLGCPLR